MTEDQAKLLTDNVRTLMGFVHSFLPHGEKWRKGGWFCILDSDSGRRLLHEQIGTVRPDKSRKYFGYSLEKATRLHRFPGHMTSRQSRNEAAEQYGGAIRLGRFIISFSGFPEILDEALMLCAAVRSGLLFLPDVTNMASNETFGMFEALMHRSS